MPIIEVEHLHKRYRDTMAVEDVSFTVDRGEIFGIERGLLTPGSSQGAGQVSG